MQNLRFSNALTSAQAHKEIGTVVKDLDQQMTLLGSNDPLAQACKDVGSDLRDALVKAMSLDRADSERTGRKRSKCWGFLTPIL